MPITFRTDGHIPPHPGVPEETYRALVDRRLAADRAHTKALARGAQKQDVLRDKYRAAVESALGKAQYERLREFVAREREATKGLRPVPGRMIPEELERLKKARAEHAADGLKRLGVKAEAIRAINKRFIKPVMPATATKVEHAVGTEKVPAEIRKHKTNPWTIRTAPFDGWGSWLWIETRGIMWYDDYGSHEWFHDSATGFVGNQVGLSNYGGATDWDWGRVEKRSVVGFWFQMDRPGLVELWVEAQVAFNRHEFDAWDYFFGWSEWSMLQENFIWMKVLAPQGDSQDGMSRTTYMTGDWYFNAHWNASWMESGTSQWGHYVSDRAYGAGDWVWIEVGTRNASVAFADDFEIDSRMEFRYFIRGVHAHSTG